MIAGGVIICALFASTAMAATHKISLGRLKGSGILIQLKQLNNSEIIRLIINNPGGKRIKITLSDLSGSFISQVVGSKSEKVVLHDYDFSSAEDGTYYLDIYDGHSNLKREIHLQRVPQKDITTLTVE